MATDVALEDRSLALSPMELLQGAATCVALTVLAYARMAGADPLFQFVWRSRPGSALLFALLAAASIASVSLVIGARRTPRERAVQLISHFATLKRPGFSEVVLVPRAPGLPRGLRGDRGGLAHASLCLRDSELRVTLRTWPSASGHPPS